MRDPLGPPPAARHPDTVFLFAMCVFAGIGQLSPLSRSGVTDFLPYWLTAAWGVLLILGGAVTLTGVFWRNRVTGLLLEFAGRCCFGPAAFIYGAAIIAAAGAHGILAAAPFVGFSVSSLWRARQIHHAVGDVRDVLSTMRWAQENRDEP